MAPPARWPAAPCRGQARTAGAAHGRLGSGPAVPTGRSASELAEAFARVHLLHSEKASQKRLYEFLSAFLPHCCKTESVTRGPAARKMPAQSMFLARHVQASLQEPVAVTTESAPAGERFMEVPPL